MTDEELEKTITINPKALILARDAAGNMALTPEATVEIEKILAVKKLIEEIYEHIQKKLTEQMGEQGLQKIQAGTITVAKRFYGERYQITDKSVVPGEFMNVREYVKPNPAAIDAYAKEKGTLPPGIQLRPRAETVSITERGHEE